MEKKVRSSNVEILRIICMFMIVLNHCVTHGKLKHDWTTLSVNRVFSELVSLGQVGVSCFVLISGYFMVNSTFKLKKLIYLWLVVEFYSLSLFGINVALGFAEFTKEALLVNLFPILNSRYWFITIYMGMYICVPALNVLIKNIDREMHKKMILVAVTMFSVLPTLMQRVIWGDYRFTWFIVLYLIAAYIRLYPDSKWFTLKSGVMGCIISFAFICGNKIYFDYMTVIEPGYHRYVNYTTSRPNKTTVLLLALSLLIVFINLKIKNIKWINSIAASTLAVYIIHDNAYIRNLLWIRLFDNAGHYQSPWFPLYLIGISALVFTVCVIIDKIRVTVVRLFIKEKK